MQVIVTSTGKVVEPMEWKDSMLPQDFAKRFVEEAYYPMVLSDFIPVTEVGKSRQQKTKPLPEDQLKILRCKYILIESVVIGYKM